MGGVKNTVGAGRILKAHLNAHSKQKKSAQTIATPYAGEMVDLSINMGVARGVWR